MVKANRTQNTKRNIIAGLVTRILELVLPFIIRTIIIMKLGAEYTGLNSLFSSILQVLSVAELGFSSAITFALYAPVANDDFDAIRELLSLYRKIYRIVGSIILISGLLVCPFLKCLIHGSYPSDINIYILYLIYLSNTVISYYAFGYKNVILSVNQRNDIISNIASGISLLRGAIQITVLMLTNSFYLYIIFLPIFTLVSNILVSVMANKMFPEYYCVKKNTIYKLADISEQIKGVAIGRLSLVSRNAFDSIILSAVLGLTVSAIYSNYYYVFSAVSMMLVVILTGMSASVGNTLVLDGPDKVYKDHEKFDFYYEFLVAIATTSLFCLYQPFMRIWVGENLMFSNSTMILFCIYFYVNQLSQVRSVYSEAAGIWWKFKWITIGEMACNLLLNFVLGINFGVNGILFATIITAFVSSFILLSKITFETIFLKSPISYYLSNLKYAIITVLGSLLVGIIVKRIEVIGWGSLIVKCIVTVVAACGFYLTVYILVPRTRGYVLSGISQIISIRTKKQ